jgi:hypothetical protein
MRKSLCCSRAEHISREALSDAIRAQHRDVSGRGLHDQHLVGLVGRPSGNLMNSILEKIVRSSHGLGGISGRNQGMYDAS